MLRRSSRLMHSGYYKSDSESDSGYVPTVSYRETHVKIFKKRTWKGITKSLSSAESNEGAATTEPHSANTMFMGSMKTAFGLALLLLMWFLFYSSISFNSRINENPLQTKPRDPAIVSANAKLQDLMEELQLKQLMQEQLFSRMQVIKAKLELLDSNRAIRLGDKESCSDCCRPMADKMADFALASQGARVVSSRCSETYRGSSATATLFGLPLWYTYEKPCTVIQGDPVLLPGKCWAFQGVQGTLAISLSLPIKITHVTLDHLSRENSPTGRIDSAPKDFEIYGLKADMDAGTLLGTFTYNEYGESTQTFKLTNPSDVLYRSVELRILSNWGNREYTCVYRFRVHGEIAST